MRFRSAGAPMSSAPHPAPSKRQSERALCHVDYLIDERWRKGRTLAKPTPMPSSRVRKPILTPATKRRTGCSGRRKSLCRCGLPATAKAETKP